VATSGRQGEVGAVARYREDLVVLSVRFERDSIQIDSECILAVDPVLRVVVVDDLRPSKGGT